MGYTVDLVSEGSADAPFAWLTTGSRKNLPAMPAPVAGICRCESRHRCRHRLSQVHRLLLQRDLLLNFRQLPRFSFRATLYRLAGKPPAAGVQLQNNGGNGFSLFSVINTEATPPANNGQLFNLVRFQLQQNTRVSVSPCGSFGHVNVDMGKVPVSAFDTVGQPARGNPGQGVAVSAKCSAGVGVNWAVVGQPDKYDLSGLRTATPVVPGTANAHATLVITPK